MRIRRKIFLILKIWKSILLFLVTLFLSMLMRCHKKYQTELIELRCISVLEAKFRKVVIKMFHQQVGPTYPQTKE